MAIGYVLSDCGKDKNVMEQGVGRVKLGGCMKGGERS